MKRMRRQKKEKNQKKKRKQNKTQIGNFEFLPKFLPNKDFMNIYSYISID